jgi:hypothetical protein
LTEVEVRVYNVGSVAVRDFSVRVIYPDGTALNDFHTWNVFAPDVEVATNGTESLRRYVRTKFFRPLPVTRTVLEPHYLRVEIVFRDANGRRWRRIDDEDPSPATDFYWTRIPTATELGPVPSSRREPAFEGQLEDLPPTRPLVED